jgi:DNA-binding CsgD family transcriptional regulator
VSLLGRDREVGDVLGWIGEANRGSSRVVLITGDAGIGKTALVQAITEQTTDSPTVVATGRTTELPGAPPFRPWRQVLGALGGETLLTPTDDDVGEVDRFARFDAVARFLADRARANGGLVVVLEDVHRADDPSIHLLVHVAETLADDPVCLLLTARSLTVEQTSAFQTASATLTSLAGSRRLDLRGLAPSEVEQLLGPEAGEELVAEAAAVTGGNPLFLRELARHWAAGGARDEIPASIVDCVRARLRDRSASCISVLQAAAVVGREFTAGLVATATGESATTCLEALDEAVQAGLVEPSGAPGWFRFVHIVVRDAVEADLGASTLARTHRQVALAIEAYDGTADDHLADLARHWDAAAVLGDRAIAASWCERAAASADRRLAWEDAARLYDRAVELIGPDGDPLDRHRLLLAGAGARQHCDDVNEAVARCVRAADAVRHLGQPDLLSAAALVVEARGGPPLASLRALAEEALTACAPDDDATRARLLGQLATCAFYLDPPSAEPLSVAAADAAEASDDPLARVAAARARQLALAGPEHASERLELASVMGDAGRQLGRPSITQWEAIWRIDALVELGRLPEATGELPILRQRVATLGHPISMYHLQRCEALLAQAAGRFDDALAWATRTCELFGRLEDERGGRAMLVGFETVLALHAGFDDELVRRWDSIDLSQAPPFLGDLPILGPVMAIAGAGAVDRASALYERLGPVDAWDPPRFLWLHLHATRLWAAVTLGRSSDVAALIAELDRHRGTHIGAGGGGLSYLGPVELWIGVGAAKLDRLDEAAASLREAQQTCERASARAFAVQAGVELADTLARRNDAGDPDEARALVQALRPAATSLGMVPWVRSIDALDAQLSADGRPTGPLTTRELEVAALVAEGLTNRAIAERLFLSERTAQNHVQHILTKLGVSNRTQVASWYADGGPAADRRRE